ncbi:MAG: tripartite tricarboxylate transporter TctB family protein [Amylibacter sp.]
MSDKLIQLRLGIGAICLAAFLLLIAIPFWVTSPSNVPNIILSPIFWPNTLAIITALTGIGLVLSGLSLFSVKAPKSFNSEKNTRAFFRLSILGFIMGITILVMPSLGLVWTMMLVFSSSAFLVGTTYTKTAIICSIVLPLILYLFFAHVAGVAIPQGDYVRLP